MLSGSCLGFLPLLFWMIDCNQLDKFFHSQSFFWSWHFITAIATLPKTENCGRFLEYCWDRQFWGQLWNYFVIWGLKAIEYSSIMKLEYNAEDIADGGAMAHEVWENDFESPLNTLGMLFCIKDLWCPVSQSRRFTYINMKHTSLWENVLRSASPRWAHKVWSRDVQSFPAKLSNVSEFFRWFWMHKGFMDSR